MRSVQRELVAVAQRKSLQVTTSWRAQRRNDFGASRESRQPTVCGGFRQKPWLAD
jgi:hypothetical protein